MTPIKLTDVQKKTISDTGRALAEASLPYQKGAKLPLGVSVAEIIAQKRPIDCSGLARYVLAAAGVKAPDGSQCQYAASVTVGGTDLIEIGDLAFKKTPGAGVIEHVAIVIAVSPVVMIAEAEGWYGHTLSRTLASFSKCLPRANQFAGIRRLTI